jgi:pyruvate/2-oxoglutarate dehydrogenase complex dihydrolipoamide dehydrogenase (E3) component
LSSRRQRRHDLVVIGGGSAGLVAADFGARFGADVLLIEKDKIGGDCTWTGCVPSKALLHTAGVAHQIRAASHIGIRSRGAEVDFPEVMRRVREAVAAVYSFETPEQLRGQGIEVEFGEARFLDRASVEVAGRCIQARNFIICTGAVPQRPPVHGLEAVPYVTYEEVFDLDELPGRLLLLGGGPVGVELAQAFARLGSEVTLAEKESRLLAAADDEAADNLTRRLAADGVRIETGLDLEQVSWDSSQVAAGSARGRLPADLLLVATGRRPEVEGLHLAQAGVDHNERGIRVDQNLKTSQANIYAAGDVTGSFQFTHYAGWQGCAAARNALFTGSAGGVTQTVPWAVFTQPELAQVGLTEELARAQGRKVTVSRLALERVDRAQTSGDTDGFIKIVASPSGKVLGGTIVAPVAAELANELSIAIAGGLDLQRLASTMHVYPTIGLGIQQIASDFAFERARTGLRGAVSQALVTRFRR